jgi:hypothetical protein
MMFVRFGWVGSQESILERDGLRYDGPSKFAETWFFSFHFSTGHFFPLLGKKCANYFSASEMIL